MGNETENENTLDLTKWVVQTKKRKQRIKAADFKEFIKINDKHLNCICADGCWGATVEFPSDDSCRIVSDIWIEANYNRDGLQLILPALYTGAIAVNKDNVDECLKGLKARRAKNKA